MKHSEWLEFQIGDDSAEPPSTDKITRHLVPIHFQQLVQARLNNISSIFVLES